MGIPDTLEKGSKFSQSNIIVPGFPSIPVTLPGDAASSVGVSQKVQQDTVAHRHSTKFGTSSFELPASSTDVPSARVGVDTNGDGKPDFFFSGPDWDGDGIPDS